jgi:hypothetical protein
MGVKLSIDDFGTGYSSLSYLRRFPVDVLKIDRSFVRDITSSEDDAAMVSAIIELARGLRMRVIAEGVETEAQLDYLKRRGCDEVQGHVYARAASRADVEAMLRNGRHMCIRRTRDGPYERVAHREGFAASAILAADIFGSRQEHHVDDHNKNDDSRKTDGLSGPGPPPRGRRRARARARYAQVRAGLMARPPLQRWLLIGRPRCWLLIVLFAIYVALLFPLTPGIEDVKQARARARPWCCRPTAASWPASSRACRRR